MTVDKIVCVGKNYLELKAGDIVFTGTPAGVIAVSRGSIAELRWCKYHYSVLWE